MYFAKALLLTLLPFICPVAGSFYDNPQVVIPDPDAMSVADLENKWGVDVSIL